MPIRRVLFAGALVPFVLALADTPQDTAKRRATQSAAVRAIFKAHCVSCHGGPEPAAKLDLSTDKGILAGRMFTPGKGADSVLVHRVKGLDGKPKMPMGFAPLTAAQIDTLAAWIEDGGVLSAAPKIHWAYVKPVRPTLPEVSSLAWCRNEIDRFILKRLNQQKLKPSREASRETLIRRLSLDLIGLPPTPTEVDTFLADRSTDAYEKVVDRLLASPHYGERQARPWLDLARFADTNGYEKDGTRAMWSYRDWVINAFNENKPYDQFTREQIAGDMLPKATLAQRIATGFNRNVMYNTEGGVDQGEQRWLRLVDMVGTTSQTWLGTTLQCAQCHDHKYDPFSQKDFYRFLAFFESADTPTIELRPEVEAQRKALREKLAKLDAKSPEREKLQGELNSLSGPYTDVFAEARDRRPQTPIRIRGGYLSPGATVDANTPTTLNPMGEGVPKNRLGLAQWLVSRNNPLTARVEVNRIWETYFGRGIVETSENFGTQGSPPSHPELLDWLATEFMRRNWDMKAMNKLIVMSATYRQSSATNAVLLAKDPQNIWLARGPRFRMEAETLRDNALAISGLLSPKMGGPSVFPAQPEGVWDSPYSGETWQTSSGEDRYRRGLYTFWKRTATYPAFTVMDATSRESCTIRRIRTNTPLQALAMLNDPAYLEAARALAERMKKEGGPTPEREFEYGFRLCVARKPTAAERARLITLYEKAVAKYQKMGKTGPDALARTLVANVLLNLDETITKE